MSRSLATVVLSATLIVLSATTVQAQSGPPNIALLIGVNEYPRDTLTLKKLDAAENDAVAIAAALELNGFKTIVMTSKTGERDKDLVPTQANIIRQIDLLLGRYDKKAEKNVPVKGGALPRWGTVLIGFMGHGVTFTKDQRYFLCPTDAIAHPDHAGTMIVLQDIIQQAEGCNATNRLLVIDACRSELDPSKLPTGKRGLSNLLNVKQSTGLLLSCDSQQISWELQDKSHGIFSHYFIEALTTDKALDPATGTVTWDRIRSHVKSNVRIRAMAERKTEQDPLDYGSPSPSPVLARPKEPARLSSKFNPDKASETQKAWGKFISLNHEESVTVKDAKVSLRLIPPADFTMGSPKTEPSRGENEEVRHVRITRPYFISQFEITQEQFRDVMGRNPSHWQLAGKGGPRLKDNKVSTTDKWPVENVTWQDAKDYCDKLTKFLGSEPQWRGYTCRLPTEAEWEFACRAGTDTPFYFGDTCNNLLHCSCDLTHFYPPAPMVMKGPDLAYPVVCSSLTNLPNPFGLYHMHGNIDEWCEDGYEASPKDDVTDPLGVNNDYKVVRGGSYSAEVGKCRSAARDKYETNKSAKSIGFRIVLVKDK